MKRFLFFILISLLITGSALAQTRSIVPRADGEGSLGTAAKKWGTNYVGELLSV